MPPVDVVAGALVEEAFDLVGAQALVGQPAGLRVAVIGISGARPTSSRPGELELGGPETELAAEHVARDLAEHDAAGDVVQVDAHEVGLGPERSEMLDHLRRANGAVPA